MISSSRRRAASSPKTRAATAGRSSDPSGVITSSPNSLRTSASPSVPRATTSRANWSASITTAPSSASRLATTLLPAPIPPVSPITSTPQRTDRELDRKSRRVLAHRRLSNAYLPDHETFGGGASDVGVRTGQAPSRHSRPASLSRHPRGAGTTGGPAAGSACDAAYQPVDAVPVPRDGRRTPGDLRRRPRGGGLAGRRYARDRRHRRPVAHRRRAGPPTRPAGKPAIRPAGRPAIRPV